MVLRLVLRREGERLCGLGFAILSVSAFVASNKGRVGVAIASSITDSTAEVSFLFFLGFFGLDFLDVLFEKEAEKTFR